MNQLEKNMIVDLVELADFVRGNLANRPVMDDGSMTTLHAWCKVLIDRAHAITRKDTRKRSSSAK